MVQTNETFTETPLKTSFGQLSQQILMPKKFLPTPKTFRGARLTPQKVFQTVFERTSRLSQHTGCSGRPDFVDKMHFNNKNKRKKLYAS